MAHYYTTDFFGLQYFFEKIVILFYIDMYYRFIRIRYLRRNGINRRVIVAVNRSSHNLQMSSESSVYIPCIFRTFLYTLYFGYIDNSIPLVILHFLYSCMLIRMSQISDIIQFCISITVFIQNFLIYSNIICHRIFGVGNPTYPIVFIIKKSYCIASRCSLYS